MLGRTDWRLRKYGKDGIFRKLVSAQVRVGKHICKDSSPGVEGRADLKNVKGVESVRLSYDAVYLMY